MTKHTLPLELRSAAPLETRDDHDDDALAEATRAVEELRSGFEEFRSSTEERVTTELRSIGERLDELDTRTQRPGGQHEQRDEAAQLEQRAFLNFVRYGREVMEAEEVRALKVSDDTKGGYLADSDFVTEMIRNLVEISPVRQLARVGTTGRGSVVLPKRTAITNAQWENETEESAESEPAFAQIEIPVNEIRTYTDVSVKLLEDAEVDVAAELSMAFAEDFGRKEGIAFVSGDGHKKPRGFMAHDDVGYVANGHATNLQADGMIDLVHSLPAFYRNRGAWTMNGSTIGAVRKLKNSSGDYLWRDALSEGNPPTILGRPVVEAPDMPDIGSGTFPIAFGAFADAYRIYDRVALTVLRDPFTQAKKGLVRFHARRRVGGDVVKAEAIKKLKMSVS